MSATFYTIMMAVAFSLSGIFLIVAIILFFKLRIRMVIEELSGRRARKQVAEIRKENTATKSRGYVPEIFGDNESKPNVTSSKEEAKKRITEMLIAQTNDNSDEDTGGTVLLNDVINVQILDLRGLQSAPCAFFVIASGNVPSHVTALSDHVHEIVKKATGLNPSKVEGYMNAEWILMDYFDVVVHIFQQDKRQFFRLEQLWADAAHVEI